MRDEVDGYLQDILLQIPSKFLDEQAWISREYKSCGEVTGGRGCTETGFAVKKRRLTVTGP